jgi:transcriptional regulator with XRE-family HTH domain
MTRQADISEDGEVLEKNARRANPIDGHVGGRVRLRRMLLGMSQEKLAEQLGLTFQQVQKYEKGINRIGASRLFELSQLLGVGVAFFYEDAPTLSNGAPQLAPGFAESSAGENYIVDFLNSREGLDLNRAFMRITDAKVRRSIIDLVKSLANETDPPAPAS